MEKFSERYTYRWFNIAWGTPEKVLKFGWKKFYHKGKPVVFVQVFDGGHIEYNLYCMRKV